MIDESNTTNSNSNKALQTNGEKKTAQQFNCIRNLHRMTTIHSIFLVHLIIQQLTFDSTVDNFTDACCTI